MPGAVALEAKRPGVKLTTKHHPVPKLIMVELYLHSPKHFHDLIIN
jgi:hypothetical protein